MTMRGDLACLAARALLAGTLILGALWALGLSI